MPEDKAAVERAAAEKTAAAVSGADAVAKAVAKVADAAVDEIRKMPSGVVGPEIRVTGTPGGKFAIDGSGFSTSGTVKFNGVQVKTTGWSASHVEGELPSDVTSGEVTVAVDDKTIKRGYFTRT